MYLCEYGYRTAMITPTAPLCMKNLVWSLLLVACLASTVKAKADEFPLQSKLDADTVLSAHMKEWTRTNSLRLRLRNQSDSVVLLRLETTVLSEGHSLASASPHATEIVRIEPRADTLLRAEQLLPVLRMNYSDKRYVDRHSGLLTTTGDLTICVNVFDTSGLKALSPSNCIQRSVFAYLSNSLVFPAENDTVRGTPIIFRWTGIQPKPPHCVYKLKVFAREAETYLAQVVRSATPLLDTLIHDSTYFQWVCPAVNKNTGIVWQVRSTDGDLMFYGSTDGYSSLGQFVMAPAVAGAQRSKPIPRAAGVASKKLGSVSKKKQH